MSMTVTHNGQPIEVFARDSGDFIDMIVRADSHGYWQNVAEDWGLVDADGNSSPGVIIDPIGSVEIAPGVVDTRYHLNLRVSVDFDWKPFAVKWLQEGAVTSPNASETGKRFYRVTLIDPDTIVSPSRVFL